MHEMTIVAGVLQIAEEQARAAEARVINRVEMEVGDLAGVEVDALRFCFEAARRDTLAAGAELVIHRIAGRGRCPACDRETHMDYPVAVCPDCGDAVLDVLQGRELRVRSLDVD